MPFPVRVPFYPGLRPNELLSREGDAVRAEDYLMLAREMLSAPTLVAMAPRDGWVLDAGCGGGRWLARLHEAGCRVIGLDADPEVLGVVHSRLPSVPLLRGHADRLPLRDGSLAGIVSLGVVEHDPEGPARLLGEYARVLRPGGRLLVSVPFNNCLRRLWFNPLYRLRDRRLAGEAHQFVEFRFSRREIEEELGRAGLVPIARCPHDFVPPRNMAVVADRNMLAIHFERTTDGWRLRLPEARGWQLSGWWRAVVTALFRLSPWLVAAEILVIAEKPSASTFAAQRAGDDSATGHEGLWQQVQGRGAMP
jgi:SAM-dependent methyltransferase